MQLQKYIKNAIYTNMGQKKGCGRHGETRGRYAHGSLSTYLSRDRHMEDRSPVILSLSESLQYFSEQFIELSHTLDVGLFTR